MAVVNGRDDLGTTLQSHWRNEENKVQYPIINYTDVPDSYISICSYLILKAPFD
jgi:hypothetical protein